MLFAAVYLPPKNGGILVLRMVWTTSFKFIMRPPRVSKRFTSLKQKKVRHGGIQRIGWLTDRLDDFAATKSPRIEVAMWAGSLSPSMKSFWDNKLDLFGLKISWDVARAFVM
jgi:hypothetical protein